MEILQNVSCWRTVMLKESTDAYSHLKPFAGTKLDTILLTDEDCILGRNR